MGRGGGEACCVRSRGHLSLGEITEADDAIHSSGHLTSFSTSGRIILSRTLYGTYAAEFTVYIVN